MPSLGIIPIRYQSTRFPNKTFAKVQGKTLLDWTIDVAKLSNLDEIIVVTSCKNIWDYCHNKHIAVCVRPIGLEGDNCHVLHTINWLNESAMNSSFSIQMLLQITNPLREIEDINTSLDLLEREGVNSVASVCDVGECHPSRMFKPTNLDGIEPLLRGNHWENTQNLGKVYLRDGSIYAWKTKAFLYAKEDTLLPPLTVKLEIPVERSIRVDVATDLVRVENYLTKA